MPDYGHPLRFGTFITPTNAPAQRPVDLAIASERLGYDLVTFQDHPYQPGFHDTWTLLTWVAAQTSRIQISGNVLNIPLRQPAVLARSAASLDLLSGGRVAMGLGSGGFWEAIEAMGGRRLRPGEAVEALDEAIEVIRAIWDTSVRGGARAGGDHHRVAGAKRGPAPAHDIPIWIGAYKPRMLRLTGRSGDGWLPSLPYLQPGDLARGNAVIDAAAEDAGRDPREITRLLNLQPNLPAEEIARLALEDGMSTFIVMGDDERTLERFAGEIVPAVREMVGDERASRGTAVTGRVRGAAALAQRRPGIDYDAVPPSLTERTIEPGDRAYGRYRSTYLRGGRPGLVLRPEAVGEVQDAVTFAATQREVPLGVLSAGHGVSGRSVNDGGLVIDVSAMNDVAILDAESGRVRVGPGARWIDVARALAPRGLAITSGDFGGVGVGGLATAGGIGWFAREHGLTIDHLRAVEIVLADGTLRRASASENQDLFWAVRGAGQNFGIVTAFEFEAARVGQVGFAQFVFDATDTADLLSRWGEFMENADRAVSGQVALSTVQGGQRVGQAMLVVDSDDPDQLIGHLQPIAQLGPLVDQRVTMGSYDDVVGAFPADEPQRGQGEPTFRSALANHLDPDMTRALAEIVDRGAAPLLQIRSVGGAVADVPADETAYGWRDANFSIVAVGSAATGLPEAWQRVEEHADGMYLSFDTRTPAPVERAFPPAHLTRLRRLKREYDPTGLFRDNFFIAPE
ncbi:LLM class flavin-dependent oxidoreductase [Georgenia deserti]|uniref:LLM class flavin-dependent oxidoreductase n=1 Tax=Georgenia deserti TaxID=2093781 RepID=A0ABW4L2S1_9MICO